MLSALTAMRSALRSASTTPGVHRRGIGRSSSLSVTPRITCSTTPGRWKTGICPAAPEAGAAETQQVGASSGPLEPLPPDIAACTACSTGTLRSLTMREPRLRLGIVHPGRPTRQVPAGNHDETDSTPHGRPPRMSTVATAEPRVAVRRMPLLRGVAMGFAATLIAGLVLAAVAAGAIGWLSVGRVMPGVQVAGISLVGSDPSEASSRLHSGLPSLANGSARLAV